MKPLGTGSFLIGGAALVVAASIWGFWTLYKAGPPVVNKPVRNINTTTNTAVVPVPVNTNRNTNTNPPTHQITNMAGPTNSQVNTNDKWVSVAVSNVNITTNGTTGTATWTTKVPTGGIFYYGESLTSEHQVRIDGYNHTTNSVSFPVVPGTTYHYAIEPCYQTATGGVNCNSEPTGTFTAGQPTSQPAQSGAAMISDITTSYTSGTIIVSWNVSPNADGIVNWGPTADYGQHLSDYAFSVSHSISFAVAPGSTVHYAIRSCTPAPNSLCTESADMTFTAP